ncbi:MAG: acyl-CoA/acyl-ACP dehydrogenase, partial [Planctomycetota bacterium]|nr:acyl-CoA/acyl-ACP dehydrogenase [Planctomycetota bacterium]
MSLIVSHDAFQTLVRTLSEIPEPDSADIWPSAQFELLAEAGGNRWNIPCEFGGAGADDAEMLEVYRELASGSLLTTFILTQRNAACQRIATSQNTAAKDRLLPALCDGRIFATVGISHLTTSRQHLSTPPVVATADKDLSGYRLTGSVPWATGVATADVLVTGGTLDDGRQILAAIPTSREGMYVQAPTVLMGLSSSQTSIVELQNVFVSDDEVLHGPVQRVMALGTGGGAGSLGTSAVAIGTAQGTLRMFREEVDRRPELAEFVEPLQKEASTLTQLLRDFATSATDAGTLSAEEIRQRANSLVLRSAQAWLAATKGAGFIAG